MPGCCLPVCLGRDTPVPRPAALALCIRPQTAPLSALTYAKVRNELMSSISCVDQRRVSSASTVAAAESAKATEGLATIAALWPILTFSAARNIRALESTGVTVHVETHRFYTDNLTVTGAFVSDGQSGLRHLKQVKVW